jgi:hypothetical protein
LSAAEGAIDNYDEKVSKFSVPHDGLWYHPGKPFEIEPGSGQYMLIWMKNVGDGRKNSIRGSKAFREGMREIAEDQLEGKTSYWKDRAAWSGASSLRFRLFWANGFA